MIKVEFVSANKTGNGIDIRTSTGNLIAKDLAEKFTKDLSDRACNLHPNFVNVLTVKAGRPLPDINFTQVCCQEFQDSFSFQTA